MSDLRCICQDQHRRGYCRERGCPYSLGPFTRNYGQDVGNLHVIDHYLCLCAAELNAWTGIESPQALRFSPADWSR